MLTQRFTELSARERAQALLDDGTFHELLGPFDRLESPHLAPQGIVPASDDGVVIARGTVGGAAAVVLAIEGAFQGGGIGEINGSKLAATLERVLEDNKNGRRLVPIIVFDTGGVRLQEANYGLLLIAEIQSAIVALRPYVPVIGLIPGNVGCFGGMSITAALCSRLLMTKTARFGLNGPEVIEQEAGVQEFDSRDRRLIWDTIGGAARYATGLVDMLIEDDSTQLRAAVLEAFTLPPTPPRTQQVEKYLALVNQLDPTAKPTTAEVSHLLGQASGPTPLIADARTPSRGRTWFAALTHNAPSSSDFPGVLVADVAFAGQLTRFIAVVPNATNRYPRARHGEVGLQEGWTLAKYVRQALEADQHQPTKRPIVALIDVPSQAYGYVEELAGIHYACAASADAYATARHAGHPVVGVVVGNAISGAFLAHGLQASRLLALNDAGINVQAMSKQSAARITKRTLAELETAAHQVPAMAYDVHSYYTLGALEPLLNDVNADEPQAADVAIVADRLAQAIQASDGTLAHRLQTEPARAASGGRAGSRLVREKLAAQWT